MTIGIGLYTPKGVSLFADRRTCFGTEILQQNKIHKAGKYTFIAAGYSAGRELFEILLSKNPDMHRLRAAVDAKNWTPNANDGAPMSLDVMALVTNGKMLWRVGGDLVAYEIARTPGFDAIGSGAMAALGALHAGSDPTEAIEIASQLCSGCGDGQDRVDVPKGRAR